MVKRYLDVNLSDIEKMTKKDKLDSIKLSEGRTLVTEVIGAFPGMLGDISNAELAAAFGSDILLLNVYDVDKPYFYGIEADNIIGEIKKRTGRLVGVNLEPVDESLDMVQEKRSIAPGRTAKLENVKKLIDDGCDFIVLTGNPATGVTNEKIQHSIKEIRKHFGQEIMIFAGKMHSAGDINEIGSKLYSKELALDFIEAGADVLLLPAPGTVPGFTMEMAKEIIDLAHDKDTLTLTAIGTSQEGSDQDTIRRIALMSKMAGTDMHHVGDAGICPGVSTPENIMAYSIVIKGKRHTYRRMARTIEGGKDGII